MSTFAFYDFTTQPTSFGGCLLLRAHISMSPLKFCDFSGVAPLQQILRWNLCLLSTVCFLSLWSSSALYMPFVWSFGDFSAALDISLRLVGKTCFILWSSFPGSSCSVAICFSRVNPKCQGQSPPCHASYWGLVPKSFSTGNHWQEEARGVWSSPSALPLPPGFQTSSSWLLRQVVVLHVLLCSHDSAWPEAAPLLFSLLISSHLNWS